MAEQELLSWARSIGGKFGFVGVGKAVAHGGCRVSFGTLGVVLGKTWDLESRGVSGWLGGMAWSRVRMVLLVYGLVLRCWQHCVVVGGSAWA